jgi:GNAT superfamily N-acetyltransferase
MNPVSSTAQIHAAMQTVKKADRFVTNFFPTEAKLQRWVDRQELTIEAGLEIFVLLRRDRDFHHLYYHASGFDPLDRALRELTADTTLTLVADLVGRAVDLTEPAAAFVKRGFRPYTRLLRLARIVTGPGTASELPGVQLAQEADAKQALTMLEASFDRYAEQLPDSHEIISAIADHSILVVRDGTQIAGLLFFERTGFTSTIRYWLVDPAHRDRKVGARLMRSYFSCCPEVRRFILWVLAANGNALQRYEHYDYAPDGLCDQVMMFRPSSAYADHPLVAG